MNLRTIITTIALGMGASSAGAQPSDLSGIPAAFVDIGFGARAAALGNAFAAAADDASAVFWNPAGLSGADGLSAAFTTANQFGLVPYRSFSVGGSLGPMHSAGLGLVFSGDDQLSETSFFLSYAVDAGGLIWGEFQSLSVGLDLKIMLASFGKNTINAADFPIFAAEEIEEARARQVTGDASGIAGDLGLLYRPRPGVRVAVVWKNLFAPVTWNSSASGSYGQSIPGQLTVGVAYAAQRDVLLLMNLDKGLGQDVRNGLRLGLERRLLGLLALRAGYVQDLSPGYQKNYALGGGFYRRLSRKVMLTMDYAVVFHSIANTHRFSVGFGL